MNRLRLLALCLGLMLFAASCVSNKRIIYLQNLEGNTPIPEDQLITYEMPEYRLQYNDIVEIQIKTVDDFLQSGFGPPQNNMNMNMMQGAQGGGDVYYMTGYTVDKHGNIRLPIIGDVNVLEMTLDETRAALEKELKEFVTTELFVRVKLGGIRFSTIGEFRRPGKYTILQDRMTIFEAIAHAGDMTIAAKRDELLLIRQYPDGTKLHRVNLQDRQLISSPFYFIQPNDQLYAEPMKVREIGAGENAAQSISLIISSLSLVALVLNLVLR
ncbi:polysaccharide biosynthesis/export family protein [Mongoliitalea daihaiensis]|uniref:polysaccharide biosynthesis/export family protein n=1 Tax=Mongoliitalea daihaiensis TaxID=2782006 RepID=UPI001F1E2C74|nr:polysaccharide biosynthesis/export family protein [Mongoliitalea daihaiensis]UJP64483.1 polysaccharide biosynthesis/export family protein [Mongoliitalea daihaiensis]